MKKKILIVCSICFIFSCFSCAGAANRQNNFQRPLLRSNPVPEGSAPSGSSAHTGGIGLVDMAGAYGAKIEFIPSIAGLWGFGSTGRNATLRFSSAFGVTHDSDGVNRKHILLTADYILVGSIFGLNHYIGAGVNYDAFNLLNSTDNLGATGVQVFAGLQGGSQLVKVFSEIGYSSIRKDFKIEYEGITVAAGIRI